MNDDELRRHLQRRADAVASLPELLPAIRSGIASQPQRLNTSRVPALGGLVAASAILVLLVVALPRFSQAPSASVNSPSSGASSLPTAVAPGADLHVWSTEEFVAALAEGGLSGTFVVDARIELSSRRGPLCEPRDDCFYGTLADSTPAVDLYASWTRVPAGDGVEVSGMEWAWWTLPAPSDSAPLVLRVENGVAVDNPRVTYLGYAVDSASAGTWTVPELEKVDPNQRSVSQVFIVHGWLNETEAQGEFITIDCMTPPSPIPGLPHRYCQPADFLAPEPRAERFGRPSAAVSVQRSAALEFGRGEESSFGLFAVSPRLYGACAETPPCLDWDLVARISEPGRVPSPIAEPTARAKPGIACASLGEMRPTIFDDTGIVESCEVVEAPEDGQVFTSVSNPDGDRSLLLVVWSGVRCDLASTFRFSPRGDEFDLDFQRPVMDCTDEPFRHAMRMSLRDEVLAADVRATQGRIAEVEAGAAWWELAPHERPTAESTELDLIVYERACAGGHGPGERLSEVGIDYASDSVTITFRVTPLAGEGDCLVAPGAPYTVQLDQPLGDRRLVDGDDLAGVVVLQQDANFIAMATHRVDEYANERFEAMFGALGCTVTSTTDRIVPTDAEVLAAVEALGGSDGQITGGGYVSEDWLAAARAFGAVEAYVGRPKPWYILTSHDGSSALRSMSPAQIAGRTVWYPSDQARLPNRDCEQPAASPSPTPASDAPHPLESYIRDGQLYLPPGTYRFFTNASFGAHAILRPGIRLEASIVGDVR